VPKQKISSTEICALCNKKSQQKSAQYVIRKTVEFNNLPTPSPAMSKSGGSDSGEKRSK
jgi:hypothetical protein